MKETPDCRNSSTGSNRASLFKVAEINRPFTYSVLCLLIICTSCSRRRESTATVDGANNATHSTLAQRLAKRNKLDQTTWADEVSAQRYERYFTRLWDRLNQAEDKLSVLTEVTFASLHLPIHDRDQSLDLGIRVQRFADHTRSIDLQRYRAAIAGFVKQRIRIVQTEWHHARFEPHVASGPRSEITFAIHAMGAGDRANRRYIVRGVLSVTWSDERDQDGYPVPALIRVSNLTILFRDGEPGFREVLTYSRRPTDYASAHPVILYDLDRDGNSEIILSRWNRVYWNRGSGRFHEGRLVRHFQPHWEVGLMADLTGDLAADFLTVDKRGQTILFKGSSSGQFDSEAVVAAPTSFQYPSAITAGDIDGDQDLDLWVSQYKLSYQDGQMPTPYFDANDGNPASLLRNNGRGEFTDVTQEAGLSDKRNRRTYSSSLVDLDGDLDLDLLVVSDFAGVDLHLNDGKGHFTDQTDQLVDDRHLFGMAHTLADFNRDGRLDIYAIGMSSTTARRLDRLNIGRSDRPEIHQMRAKMAYGNRMYLFADDRFQAAAFADDVARTGWSWGTTACDFDLDGDRDIYVGNGFRTGRSTQDYCTRFWCHDLYTGNSTPDPTVKQLLELSIQDVDQQRISWNGYEHNPLLMNLNGKRFVDVGFLMGVSCEYDSRAVLNEDLDSDGRPDLIVAEYAFNGRGFVLTLHVYQNTLATNNNWIGVRIYDGPAGHVPIGTTVTLRATDQTQVAAVVAGDSFLSQHSHTVHFGLGRQDQVQSLEIQWPNGKRTTLQAPSVNQYHTTLLPKSEGQIVD